MPTVVIIESDGKKHVVEAPEGTSVMRAALDNSVPGILGDCGGNMTCATCHCYVDADWLPKVPAASETELAMLECALDVQPSSRLSCQLELNPDLDGLIVRLPSSQG